MSPAVGAAVKKTIATQLTKDELATLSEEVRRNNCLRMATPFDERSVDLCVELGMDFIKIASSDINDWVLIERIARGGVEDASLNSARRRLGVSAPKRGQKERSKNNTTQEMV